MKLNWSAFWRGVLAAFDWFPRIKTRPLIPPDPQSVMDAMARDWAKVGEDVRKAIEKSKGK